MSYSYTPIDSGVIQRTDDSGNTSFIPADPENVDYQAYLAQTGGGNGGE